MVYYGHMWFIKKSIVFLSLTSIAFTGSSFFVVKKAHSFNCETDLTIDASQEQRQLCEQEVAKLEEDIKKLQIQLNQQKTQTGTIKKDVAFLTTQIEQARLKIKARNSAITKITQEIKVKNKTINTLETKIDNKKASLAQLIKKTDEIDRVPFLSVVLQNRSVSDVYSDMTTFASLKRAVKENVDGIKVAKASTEKEKKSLQVKQEEEVDAKVELEHSKKVVEKSEAEKKVLLKLSQEEEVKQTKYIAEREKKRAAIRSKLFSLAGDIPEGGIPFGQAYDYAKKASELTGVRAALILAILKQESGGKVDSFGHNVGQCYLSDEITGAGKNKKTGNPVKNVMKPDRDVVPFVRIVKNLGRDPFSTPVSCPFSYGYGGAMGISQFIPSTWALYEKRISGMFASANPWNPQHAITATALLMKDNGAGTQTYTAERNAACKYYSGRSCASTTSFYGNSVMNHAKTIQEQIDVLQNP